MQITELHISKFNSTKRWTILRYNNVSCLVYIKCLGKAGCVLLLNWGN